MINFSSILSQFSGLSTNSTSGSNSSTVTDCLSIFTNLLNGLRGPQETQGNQNQEGLPENQDPDSYAQEYADENGLTLEEAKEELAEKYGSPQDPNQNFSAQA